MLAEEVVDWSVACDAAGGQHSSAGLHYYCDVLRCDVLRCDVMCCDDLSQGCVIECYFVLALCCVRLCYRSINLLSSSRLVSSRLDAAYDSCMHANQQSQKPTTAPLLFHCHVIMSYHIAPNSQQQIHSHM